MGRIVRKRETAGGEGGVRGRGTLYIEERIRLRKRGGR